MNRFSQLFGQQLSLSYGCPDRLVLRGYYPGLQRPENIVTFFRQVVGVERVDAGVLASRTQRYRQWLERSLAEQHIARFEAPVGQRKEDLVRPSYRRLGNHEGVACVLTSMELGTTFVSYQSKQGSGQPAIRRCRKRFQHLYFYVWDPVLGPMSLCLATYLPFNLLVFINGHSFVAQQLDQAGIRYRKVDNAFEAVDDVSALQAAVATLTPNLLRERCSHWARRLLPCFSPTEQQGFFGIREYAYSVAQAEYAYDSVFHRTGQLQAQFRRAAEVGAVLGGAERTSLIFGRLITRRYRGRLQTMLSGTNQGWPVLRSLYRTSLVKQYEKTDRLLRTEVCVNDPRHLGIRRGLDQLPVLLDKMASVTQRYLDVQAELLDSSVDLGELAQLAAPSLVGASQRRVPGIRLHDDRVLRLLEILLQPAGLVADWTTAHAHRRLLERYRLAPEAYRLSQLRYDLRKLRTKGLVQRIGRTRRYQLTPLGLRLGTVLVKVRTRLLGPLVTLASAPSRSRRPHPSTVEAALRQVDTALDAVCTALNLKVA